MKPIKANTPRNKIRILKLLRKEIERDFPPDCGFCKVLNNLGEQNKIQYIYPQEIGLKRPKNAEKYYPYWYVPGEARPRVASINRAIKKIRKPN